MKNYQGRVEPIRNCLFEDWNQAVKARTKVERIFNKTPTLDNLSNFRYARAMARITINKSKRNTLKNYISSL